MELFTQLCTEALTRKELIKAPVVFLLLLFLALKRAIFFVSLIVSDLSQVLVCYFLVSSLQPLGTFLFLTLEFINILHHGIFV